MEHGNLLNWIIFLPAIGAVLCLIIPNLRAVKIAAIATSGVTLLLSLLLFQDFAWWRLGEEIFGSGYGQRLVQVTKLPWIELGSGENKSVIQYFVGLDGLSFPLIILTTLVSFLAALASWNFEQWKVSRGARGYFCLFLLLETGMLGVFAALDFFLFYIFWEVMLLPMYFLIGVWGGPRKEYAAIKFFIYTLAGSVLMLVVIVAFYFYAPEGHRTFDLIRMATDPAIQAVFGSNETLLLGFRFAPLMFVLLYIGFAVKVPVFPFHTWLPDAHVEAPTPISMILAGVLLKMGAYGLMRISYPILPTAGPIMAYGLAILGLINIIYGALCAMAQTDFKRLVAYSSISHMGYVLLGLAIMTPAGWNGAMFQVIAHGISSPMCFFLVGVIYDRAHHREINRFGGLWLTMPVYGSLATVGFFASLGLPGLCGFIGEFWVLVATFSAQAVHPWMTWAKPFAIIAATGVILTAGYILWMIQRVYLGKAREEYKGYPDALPREVAILAPMAILAIALGVLPQQTLFKFMDGTLNQIAGMLATHGEPVRQAVAALAGQ
ncbi:MAG: NADH-quinone oxidoreductase subunit M [Planctomycetota bacterium]